MMIIPTHIHDDHVCGIPYLQRHRETECWALEKVTKVLSEPARWSSTPCCYDRPIRIHRRLKDGEEFDWEEYTFRAYYFPGQTEFHSAITALIDGKKVAFTGDSVYERARATWGNTVKKRPMQTQIFRNGFQLSMHKKCQQVLRQIMPDLICPGHEEPFNFDRIKLEDYCDYIEQKEALFRELSPEPVEQYVDLFWVRLLPYQSVLEVGKEHEFTVLLRNNFATTREFGARLVLPEHWKPTSGGGSITLPSGKSGKIRLSASVPSQMCGKTQRQLITVEVLVDGVSHGPVAEALVYSRGS